ncbi:hemerythrin family protein [Pseudodesulfovibrio sp.]|nr:hemerythrin family protein [Pseudodesulfovibrio sp.]
MPNTSLWKQEYLLHLDEIDDQHRHFFELCGNVVQLAEKATCNKDSIAAIIRALGSLRTYAFFHFKTEEDVMLQFGFPGYLSHTGYHNSYLQKMMEFESGFRSLLVDMKKGGMDNELLRRFLKDVAEFITDWWGVHIVTQDAKYAEHVIKKHKSDLG